MSQPPPPPAPPSLVDIAERADAQWRKRGLCEMHGYLAEGAKCPDCDYIRPLSASTWALQAVATSNEKVAAALREIADAIAALSPGR